MVKWSEEMKVSPVGRQLQKALERKATKCQTWSFIIEVGCRQEKLSGSQEKMFSDWASLLTTTWRMLWFRVETSEESWMPPDDIISWPKAPAKTK